MVALVPSNPLHGNVVIDQGDSYQLGEWDWAATQLLTLFEDTIPKNMVHPAAIAVAKDITAERFLTWSRFPFAVITKSDFGFEIKFEDARYFRYG